MDIKKEKEYIYRLMSDITDERRKLTDMYFSLRERLNELSKLEERGLTKLSVEGCVELHNNMYHQESNSLPTEKEERVLKSTKEYVKENINKKSTKEKPSLEAIESVISSILMKNGKPMRAQDIYDKMLSETDYYMTKGNFTSNVLYRIVSKGDSKVKRYKHGYYIHESVMWKEIDKRWEVSHFTTILFMKMVR
mgnify:CR=1 FL=1